MIPARLHAVLERARDRGFLGPGPLETHIRHAEGFAEVVAAHRTGMPRRFCDLGAGAGVPGLPLALRWTRSTGVLLDSSRRRCAFLRAAVAELGLTERVLVLEDRAERVARDVQWREQFEVVTARGFGRPAVTAEIGAGLVAVGGLLVVSEPPAGTARWDPAALAGLGFAPPRSAIAAAGAHYAVLEKLRETPETVPRGVGRPAKRPLW